MCTASSASFPRSHSPADLASEARLGLVSVPSSHNPCAVEALVLRDSMGAFVPPRHASRVAKLRRSGGFAARAHSCAKPGFRPDWVVMLTLTYRDGDDWRPKHVSGLLTSVREWCRGRRIACRYVWVGELQARGAIHYHIAIWLPFGTKLPKPDGKGWWQHGSTRIELARATVPYLMKYLSKGSGVLQLPTGARMHGCGGLDHSMRRAARWLRLPGFVQARSDIFDDWRRAPGGGWLDPAGVAYPSEFARCWLGDAYGLIRVVEYEDAFAAHGPFTWLHRGLAAPCSSASA